MAKKNESVSNYQEVMKALKKKDYKPLYILHGDEPFFTHSVSNYIQDHLLPEHERSFNQFLLYGRDVTDGQIVDLAERSPMMGETSLVIVREAQDIKKYDALAGYFERPNPSTVLVMNFSKTATGGKGKNDPVKRMLAAAKKTGVTLTTAKFRDYEVGPWLSAYLKEKGLDISPEANAFVVEQMGTDLSAIANEMKKLQIGLPEGTTKIEQQHVADAIGVSREFSVFELNRCIGKGDYFGANRIAQNMAQNPKANDITFITSQIHSYFCKIFLYGLQSKNLSKGELAGKLKVNPFFLKEYEVAAQLYPPMRCARIFSILRTLDMRNKGVGGESIPLSEALKETITRIMR